MKKKIAVILAAGMLLSAASCSKAPEESQTETTAASTTRSEETVPVTEEQKENSSDVESQMEIIAQGYKFIRSDYSSYADGYPYTSFAITDMNHNGRLEIIVTSIEETGAFSNTFYYEISEDYSSLERLKLDDTDHSDVAGDYLMSTNNEDHVVLYDCYMKDGEYYYLLEDCASDGWDYKFVMYYAYSFTDGVTRNFIGGCEFHAVKGEDKTTVNTILHGPELSRFETDEAYLEHMNSFWSGYERLDSCEVKWMALTDDTNFPEAIAESYEGFNPDSGTQTSITYDYHFFFDNFFGENGNAELEYVIHGD